MVEQEIFHTEALRQLAGVFYRGVMFLVGFENVRLTIETESLVKKPGAVFGIALICFVVGLVPAAGELFPIVELHRKAELLRLGGVNVKESYFFPENFF